MANVGDVEESTSDSQVTLAAPGQGKKWYLQDLSVRSDAAADITVQSPAGSNKFLVETFADEGFEKSWNGNGLAGADNDAMVIDVSAGNYNINYRAVVR